jgi:Mg2+ and Co2+ transporter CorA
MDRVLPDRRSPRTPSGSAATPTVDVHRSRVLARSDPGREDSSGEGIDVDIWLLSDGSAERYPVEDLAALLKRGEGLVWVGIPVCDDEAVRTLSEVFPFHPLAVRDCLERNTVPKVHVYPDHVFVVLHSPK